MGATTPQPRFRASSLLAMLALLKMPMMIEAAWGCKGGHGMANEAAASYETQFDVLTLNGYQREAKQTDQNAEKELEGLAFPFFTRAVWRGRNAPERLEKEVTRPGIVCRL